MYERSYGKKYSEKLTTTEIAALIRADIKAALKAGDLPKGLKVSVRSEYFANGSAIRIKVTKAPFPILSAEYLALELAAPHASHRPIPWHSSEALVVKGRLEDLHRAYNHDGSEAQFDHFDVNFYGSVDFDWRLEKAEREAFKVAFEARTAAVQP